MDNYIDIAIIFLTIVSISLLLIQNKSGGISSTFGGAGGFYGTRRGVEKAIFMLTWIVSFSLFVMLFVKFFI